MLGVNEPRESPNAPIFLALSFHVTLNIDIVLNGYCTFCQVNLQRRISCITRIPTAEYFHGSLTCF